MSNIQRKGMMITGAEGFLGSRLASYYSDSYDVILARHRALDITDAIRVQEFFRKSVPEVVLHCAAISDTGVCEQNPALSYAVNVLGTKNLAQASADYNSRFVFMSSDQIYAGSSHLNPNREDEKPELVNVYGRHKWQAEEEVLKILPEAVCLRLSWMYDFPVRGLKSNNNFLCNILRALVKNQPISLCVHDYRGITWVQEVVENVERAIELPGGIYNFGSGNSCSTYETAKKLLSLFDVDREDLLIPDEKRFANHPRNLTMNDEKAVRWGIEFLDTVDGLRHCLAECPEYFRKGSDGF